MLGRFVVVFVVFMAIGLIMPFGMSAELPWSLARPWIVSSPIFTLFTIIILPLAIATIATAPRGDLFVSRPALRLPLYGGLAVLLIAAFSLVISDFTSTRPAAYTLDVKAAEFDSAMRNRDARLPQCEAKDRSCVTQRRQQIIGTGEYVRVSEPFGSLSEAGRRGNWLSWLSLIYSTIGVLTVVALLWLTGVVIATGHPEREAILERLLFAYGLLLLWFPLRLLTTWYQSHLVEEKWLGNYHAFVVAVVVAFVMIVLLIVGKQRPQATKIFSAVDFAITAVTGYVAGFNPEIFEAFARWLSAMPLIILIVIMLVLVFALVILAVQVLGLIPQSNKPNVLEPAGNSGD